ncbi:MAG: EF-P lysine aminoacylase EpmA [Thermodesulfobacteriota bacterium]|nr:EF-P lysine aminoacylase EpmA [Thermodesulfobacteriota bacterium]
MVDPNWGLTAKRQRLMRRAMILAEIRAFFVTNGFLEVETPQRIPANAPELYIDPIPSGNWALLTSPELCMKRLLAADYPLIFQLCHCWRNAERGSKHLPEFTLLEWYRAHSDYHQLMLDCEHLLTRLVPSGQLNYQGYLVDITPPFERITLEQAFSNYAPLSLDQVVEQNCFEEHYGQYVEPQLGRNKPTILYDFPTSMAALARIKPKEPQHAERFELYIAGLELANAFSELNDESEQRRRFDNDEQQRRSAGKQPYPLPEPFLRELTNMPESAGIALGIDRLVMLLTDAKTIDQVVAFTPEEL